MKNNGRLMPYYENVYLVRKVPVLCLPRGRGACFGPQVFKNKSRPWPSAGFVVGSPKGYTFSDVLILLSYILTSRDGIRKTSVLLV